MEFQISNEVRDRALQVARELLETGEATATFIAEGVESGSEFVVSRTREGLVVMNVLEVGSETLFLGVSKEDSGS